MTILIISVFVLVLFMLGLLTWLIVTSAAGRQEIAGQQKGIDLLYQQIEALKDTQNITKETLQKSLHAGQISLNENLQSSQKILGQLNNKIGELQGTNKQMMQVGSEVRKLQDILNSPKLRGQMGERSLENLLADILPKANYEFQHTFKDGKIVDAIVYMDDYSVPIDAKFPLPAFEAMLKTDSDNDKTRLRNQFIRDVIKHIDKISSDYIRPAEGTLDFAIMYIPAENVYYEAVVKTIADAKDIQQYALDKRVIPVSPNLLYAYLMTIVMGLNGLQIEKQAAEIRQNLGKLNSDLSAFISDWDTLGTHIRNTSGKYDEAGKKLNRFSVQLDQIQIKQE